MLQEMDGIFLQARSASEGKTFSLRWRFGLVKNWHLLRRFAFVVGPLR
jgi:hypothetical protein